MWRRLNLPYVSDEKIQSRECDLQAEVVPRERRHDPNTGPVVNGNCFRSAQLMGQTKRAYQFVYILGHPPEWQSPFYYSEKKAEVPILTVNFFSFANRLMTMLTHTTA